MTTSKANKFFLFFTLLLLLLSAAGSVITLPSRALEYDEIWTQQHYSKSSFHDVFTDVSTPNNHPLHTLLVQGAIKVFGMKYHALRTPAFAAGLLTVLLALYAVYHTTRNMMLVLFATCWTAFHGYLIQYTMTARGYTLQCLFVLASCLALLYLFQHPKSWKAAVLFAVTGIMTCLTIISGLIFPVAASGTFILFAILRKEWKKHLYAGLAIAAVMLFALLWYSSIYQEIRQAQQFGAYITGVGDFFQFCGTTLWKLHLLIPLGICIVGVCIRKNPYRILSAATLVFTAAILCSAIFTKAGPERVYLPTVTPVIVIAATSLAGMYSLLHLKPVYLLLFTAVLSIYPMTTFRNDVRTLSEPEWRWITKEIFADLPASSLPVYGPSESFSVLYNVDTASGEQDKRIRSGLSSLFLVNRSEALLTVTNQAVNNTTLDLRKFQHQKVTLQFNDTPCIFLPLAPLTEKTDLRDRPLIYTVALFRDGTASNRIVDLQKNDPFCMMNLFFNNLRNCDAYIIEKPSQPNTYYLNITGDSQGTIRFYTPIK